jgi:hypothetical protein
MRNLSWVFAALVLVFGLVSTTLWRDLRTERALAVSLQSQLDEVGQAAVMPAVAAAAMPPPLSSPQTAVAVANQPAAPPAAKPQAPAAPPILADFQKQQREMMKDPEYRNARLAQIRTSVASNNRSLTEDLGISQQEADRILDLLAEYQLEMSTETVLLSDASDPAATQEMLRKRQEGTRQRDERIAALLGPSGATRWKQYQQDAPARSRATAMNNTLTRSNLPLSAAQQKTLGAALVTEMRSLREDSTALSRGANPQDPAAIAQIQEALRKRQQESTQRVLVAAAPVLSSAQLAVLKAEFDQQDALSRAMARARERAAAAQSQEAP